MIRGIDIRFEWDPEKEKINIVRHKINFTDASHVFSDVFQLNLFDKEHSDYEERWVVIGEILGIQIVVVVHTFRESALSGDVNIRIISARKATKKERSDYFARRVQ